MARTFVIVLLVVFASLAVATVASTGEPHRALLDESPNDKYNRCHAPAHCRSSCPPPYSGGRPKDWCKCLHSYGYSPQAIADLCLELELEISLELVYDLLDLLGLLTGPSCTTCGKGKNKHPTTTTSTSTTTTPSK